jgi:GntR family transcriptional regulator, vanillate catabolism transcriptional regulator
MDTQLARATASIREMILRGRLKPGQRVAEAMLADLLGMSRTPVRQALPVLAREGLLVESGTRGYVVKTFTEDEILDAIDLRGVLEGLAARRIAERGASREFLRQLHGCLEVGDDIFRKRHLDDADEVAYGEMNGRFHALILAEAGSSIIEGALCRNASIPFASAEAIAFKATDLQAMFDALHFAHQQHHAVCDALQSGQGGRVEFLMREHANAVKNSLNMTEGRHWTSVASVPARLVKSQ